MNSVLKMGIWRKMRGALPLRRALGFVWESARWWTAAGLALMVLQALLPLAALYLVKLTVDAVNAGISASHKG